MGLVSFFPVPTSHSSRCAFRLYEVEALQSTAVVERAGGRVTMVNQGSFFQAAAPYVHVYVVYVHEVCMCYAPCLGATFPRMYRYILFWILWVMLGALKSLDVYKFV